MNQTNEIDDFRGGISHLCDRHLSLPSSGADRRIIEVVDHHKHRCSVCAVPELVESVTAEDDALGDAAIKRIVQGVLATKVSETDALKVTSICPACQVEEYVRYSQTVAPRVGSEQSVGNLGAATLDAESRRHTIVWAGSATGDVVLRTAVLHVEVRSREGGQQATVDLSLDPDRKLWIGLRVAREEVRPRFWDELKQGRLSLRVVLRLGDNVEAMGEFHMAPRSENELKSERTESFEREGGWLTEEELSESLRVEVEAHPGEGVSRGRTGSSTCTARIVVLQRDWAQGDGVSGPPAAQRGQYPHWIYNVMVEPSERVESTVPILDGGGLEKLVRRLGVTGLRLRPREYVPGQPGSYGMPKLSYVPVHLLDGRSYELPIALALRAALQGRRLPSWICATGDLDARADGALVVRASDIPRKIRFLSAVDGVGLGLSRYLQVLYRSSKDVREVLGPIDDRAIPGSIRVLIAPTPEHSDISDIESLLSTQHDWCRFEFEGGAVEAEAADPLPALDRFAARECRLRLADLLVICVSTLEDAYALLGLGPRASGRTYTAFAFGVEKRARVLAGDKTEIHTIAIDQSNLRLVALRGLDARGVVLTPETKLTMKLVDLLGVARSNGCGQSEPYCERTDEVTAALLAERLCQKLGSVLSHRLGTDVRVELPTTKEWSSLVTEEERQDPQRYARIGGSSQLMPVDRPGIEPNAHCLLDLLGSVPELARADGGRLALCGFSSTSRLGPLPIDEVPTTLFPPQRLLEWSIRPFVRVANGEGTTAGSGAR